MSSAKIPLTGHEVVRWSASRSNFDRPSRARYGHASRSGQARCQVRGNPDGPEGSDRRGRSVGLRPRRRQDGLPAAPPGDHEGPRRRRYLARRGRRLHVPRHGQPAPHRARRVPGDRIARRVHRLDRGGRILLGDVPRARGRRDLRGPDRDRRPLLRLDLACRSEAQDEKRQPLLRKPGPRPVRRSVRPHAHREARHVGAAPHARIRHDHRAARGDRRLRPLQRRAQPARLLQGPDHHRGRPVVTDDRRPLHEAPLLHQVRRRRRDRPHERGEGARTAPARRCGCSERERPSRTRR